MSRLIYSGELVNIYLEDMSNGDFVVFGDNKRPCPSQVKISFPRLKNFKASVKLPYFGVLPSRQKRTRLFKITRQSDKSASYSISTEHRWGDPTAYLENFDATYLFPFKHGDKRHLDQGYNGGVTHVGKDRNAVDFPMDIGTDIYCARDGVIIEVEENFNKGGAHKSFGPYANSIIVYHEQDGVFSRYSHLKKNGALVEVGQKVKAAQIIGLSGNTGWSSGPHLHFDVVRPLLMDFDTIKTKFQGPDGQAIDPIEGRYYYAVHPGGKDFKMEFGSDLENSDFDGLTNPSPIMGEFKIITKEVDDTVLFFGQNGWAKKSLDLTLNFTLTGYRASKKLPLKLKLPPSTEIFLLLLKPKKGFKKRKYRLSSSIRYPR